MLSISNIQLTQYRNYASARYAFDEPITCITGPNGSGKTNLLDAVYLLCYTKSYFTSFHQQCVQMGQHGFRVSGAMRFEDREEEITCLWRDGQKTVSRNGVAYDRIQDYIGRHTAVMIAPDDLELINGGGELRRKWMDGVLAQTQSSYLDHLLTYTRILAQRKAWLRQQALFANADSVTLEYYDAELSAHGAAIYEARRSFLMGFAPLLERYYRRISGGQEAARLQYQSELHEYPLSVLLRNALQQDVRQQRTQYGIHRDDVLLSLGGLAVRQFASQGQKKSFLFALKLAQYEYLSTTLGRLPLLLLDDVFEKLDNDRMVALLGIINSPGFGQVLLTDTHAQRVAAAFGSYAQVGNIVLE